MRARLLALAAALLSSCAGSASGDLVSGTATVVDGDGIEIGETVVRLFAIDAPEIGQYCDREDGTRWRCGQYATVALDRLAGGKRVACEVRDRDRYDRVVASCRVGDRDLGAEMVAAGWAVAYRRFSDTYVDEEEAARRGRVGMWAGRFEMPWRWRERMRERDRDRTGGEPSRQ